MNRTSRDVYRVRYEMRPPEEPSGWGPLFWVVVLTFGLMWMC